MFDVQKGVMMGSCLIGRKNNSGTLLGNPCGMVNGGKITQSLQYGWSKGIMNMLIQKGIDFPDGM